jgi:DNA-binding Lrp family transcriptional regulator
MGNKREAHDEHDRRILAYMRRAPAGRYTAVQLARNTGLDLAEVQRRLAQLRRDGVIVRSRVTAYPAFHVAAAHAVRGSRPTAREAANRRELGRASSR